MTDTTPSHDWYTRRGKRVFDLIFGSMLLFFLLPVFLLLSLSTLAASGRPVFFSQQRPGRNGKPFVLTKFRTMRPQALGGVEDDAVRMTGLGRLLRKSSLDELPELWCVVRGDMSLVGPRPLLMEYLPLYTKEQSRRHEVLPGITGWAQIHGRNALSWEDRFEHDLWYVDHCSLGLDMKILLATFSKVLRGEGVSAPGHQTMPKFRGSHNEK